MLNIITQFSTHLKSPSTNSPHRHLDNSKRPRTHRHSPQQRRPNALPETTQALLPKRLSKTVPHTLIPHPLPKSITLHLTLHNIERVAPQPQRLARQPAIEGNLPARDLLTLDLVARRIGIHHVLERQEPDAIRLRLPQNRDGFPAVQTPQHALVRRELPHAVERAIVQLPRAVGLRLQPDAHVLDGS